MRPCAISATSLFSSDYLIVSTLAANAPPLLSFGTGVIFFWGITPTLFSPLGKKRKGRKGSSKKVLLISPHVLFLLRWKMFFVGRCLFSVRGGVMMISRTMPLMVVLLVVLLLLCGFFYQMSREQPISPRCPFHSRREFNYMKNAQEHCPMYVLLTVANPFPVPSPFHIYLGRKASSSRSRIGTLDLTQGFLRLTLSNYDVT